MNTEGFSFSHPSQSVRKALEELDLLLSNSYSIEESWYLWATTNHRLSFEDILSIYKTWYANQQVGVAWSPSKEIIAQSNIHKLCSKVGLHNSQELYTWSCSQRPAFWEAIIESLDIKFQIKTTASSNISTPIKPNWYEGSKINIVESCFNAKESDIAVITSSETSQETTKYSYATLLLQVQKYAAGFIENNIQAGDRIMLVMPFSFETIAIYLGAIYAGIEVVCVPDSFSSTEIQKRAEIAQIKATVSCVSYQYNNKCIEVFSKIRSIENCTHFVRGIEQEEPSIFSIEALNSSTPLKQPYYGNSSDVITILFSSGTTKEPKAIPWTHLSPIKCACDGYLMQDIHPEDVVTWTSGMGWMMAPWLIFATLINKATLAVYEGAFHGSSFARFVKEAKVSILGTIPSLVKIWRSSGVMQNQLTNIRLFSSTGEPSHPDDYLYLMYLSDFKSPIIEYCGGTEISGGYVGSNITLPNAPSWFNQPAFGLSWYLMSDDLNPISDDQVGEVVLIPPSIGLSESLLNKDHDTEYYLDRKGPKEEILRKHGDALYQTSSNGITYYRSQGRTDDAMNLGGIKISAVELESIFNQHETVAETAAIAVSNMDGGPEKLYVFVVLKEPIDLTTLKKEWQTTLNHQLNPLFKINEVREIQSLPRTASNKVMRRVLKELI